jgi:transposase InsO family protein
MPWEAKTVEMTREEFISEVIRHQKSKAKLCREYGISRPTGDKWLKRYKNGEGFKDRSHRPFKTPQNKTATEMEQLIIERRQEEPGIGAVKLKRILESEGKQDVPSHSTINIILKRNNLIRAEDSEAAKPTVRFEHEHPNQMWQADFKGHFQLGNGERCHPLSVLDDCSRYCLCADAKMNERREGVQPSFERVMRENGQPRILLCDNGNPWGASQSSGFSGFELWLMDHGILVMHIRPGRPKTQGKVERFNGSYKAERLRFHIPYDMQEAMQNRLEYQEFYNHIRPHHALGLDVPAKHYQSSDIVFQEEVEEWKYSGKNEVRKIKSSGYLTFCGQGYYFSEALGGREIELRQSTRYKDLFYLCYHEFWLGKLDVKNRVITSRKAYLIHGDPRILDDVFDR